MARSRSGGNGRRGSNLTANRIKTVVLPPSNHITYLNRLLRQQVKLDAKYRRDPIGDLRRWHPAETIYQSDYRPGRILRSSVVERVVRRSKGVSNVRIYSARTAARYGIKPSGTGVPFRRIIDDRWSFADPRRTIICVRRKQRREVMFAKFHMGSGGAGRRRNWRRPRRNNFSDVVC